MYELPQKMGKYMTIPRTEGVSTTDIVGRMLLMSTRHHQRSESIGGELASDRQQKKKKEQEEEERQAIFYRRSQFLTTSRMIRLFSAGMRVSGPPTRGTKVTRKGGVVGGCLGSTVRVCMWLCVCSHSFIHPSIHPGGVHGRVVGHVPRRPHQDAQEDQDAAGAWGLLCCVPLCMRS